MSVVTKRVALLRARFPSVVCEVTRIHAQGTVFIFGFRTKTPKMYDRESRKSSNVTRVRCSHRDVWNIFVANGSLRSLILSSSKPLNQSFDLETARVCFSECFLRISPEKKRCHLREDITLSLISHSASFHSISPRSDGNLLHLL